MFISAFVVSYLGVKTSYVYYMCLILFYYIIWSISKHDLPNGVAKSFCYMYCGLLSFIYVDSYFILCLNFVLDYDLKTGKLYFKTIIYIFYYYCLFIFSSIILLLYLFFYSPNLNETNSLFLFVFK